MNKILEYVDKTNSVSSFWRGRGPLAELERDSFVELTEAKWNEGWSTIRRHNIAFFQRPMHRNCLSQVMLCKDLGLKIWVDLDDWKYIPKEHYMFQEYGMAFDELSFKKILYLADVITVTNSRIYKAYTESYPDISESFKVLPNAINDYVYSIKPLSENKRIIYRGGQNHEYEIKKYQDAIRRVLVDNPDWMFYSIGSDIKRLKSLANYQYLGNFDLHTYFSLICNVNPAIMVVPLEDNPFNRCKSNIAWIEGTLAGAACLCPEYFDDTCSMEYYSKESFKEQFNILIKKKSVRAELRNDSVSKIKKEFLLSNVNMQRLQIINNLL